MRAAKKAGHVGRTFAHGGKGKGRSTFGRARRAPLSLASSSLGRRVTVMARIVRDQDSNFRSAPLARHLAYLKREGVTRDRADARMFDAASDDADAKAFTERSEQRRHHFRFVLSPEDATYVENLRTLTRELTKDVERDLGTRLDWLALDHWSTDNPHIHVLIRVRAGMVRTSSSAANISAQASSGRTRWNSGRETRADPRLLEEGSRSRPLDQPRPGAARSLRQRQWRP
jgi:hypothetical protein